MACYRALEREFKRDAKPFDIKPPIERTEPLAPVDSPPDEPTVQKRLEDLDEGVKTLLSIVDNVEKSARKTQSLVEGAFEPSESRSDGEVDLTERTNLRDLEKMLKELAFQVSGDPSFKVWMREMEPIMYPREFVESTHEEIRGNIRQMLGVEGRDRSSFPEYVSRLQAVGLLPTGSVPKPSWVLLSMNDHRNRIAHARRVEMSDEERFARSIIYLFNLALVWNYVASEPIDESEIP